LESTQGEGGQTKKAMKKGISNPVRPPPPLIGVPTFRKLELSLKAAAGRKRKEGSKQTQGGDDSVGNGTQLVPEPPAKIHGDFELHVVLPLQNSGLNQIFAAEGVFVPEEGSEEDGDMVSKEASTLMRIQKEVGFSFEGGEEEIQSKLVELEKKDKEKHVDLVQDRGDK
jgi:hypothetical protein